MWETMTVPLDCFSELLGKVCLSPADPFVQAFGPCWRWDRREGDLALGRNPTKRDVKP